MRALPAFGRFGLEVELLVCVRRWRRTCRPAPSTADKERDIFVEEDPHVTCVPDETDEK